MKIASLSPGFLLVYAMVAIPTAWAETDEEQVSTMNGQLVEVGDRNKYDFAFRRWNISSNPIGWILGTYGVSVSYAPVSVFAVRADANYYSNESVKGYELGIGAPVYFRKMYSGLFLEPGLMVRLLRSEGEGATVVGPQVLLGWHWYWDSGLNIALAGGLGRNWNSAEDTGRFEDYDRLFVNGYLRFGYAF